MANRRRANSMTDAFEVRREYQDLFQNQPGFAEAIAESLANGPAVSQSNRLKIDEFLSSLPKLTEHDITALDLRDASCPICITPFVALLAEEEMAVAMGSPAHPIEDLGVTKLKDKCEHAFCRKDIQNWLRGGHNSCPTCRHVLVDIPARSNSLPDSPLSVAQMIAMLGRIDPFEPMGARDLFEILDAGPNLPADDDRWRIPLGTRRPVPQRRDEPNDRDADTRQEFSSMYS